MLWTRAVLGFASATRSPRAERVTLWEAQFGDFAPGAQGFDQVYPLGERRDAHVRARLLLPHGYEGQGPEPSSARLERFRADVREDKCRLQTSRRRETTSTSEPAVEAGDPQTA